MFVLIVMQNLIPSITLSKHYSGSLQLWVSN